MINDSGRQIRACNPSKQGGGEGGGDQERGRLEEGLV